MINFESSVVEGGGGGDIFVAIYAWLNSYEIVVVVLL